MQFDDFDMKVKEAADNHHPAYSEQAWAKMEKLLNKHLPVEKEKKRRFLFWWILPLMLGGTALLIFKPWQQEKKAVTAVTPSTKNQAESQPEQVKKTTDNSTSSVAELSTSSVKEEKTTSPGENNETVVISYPNKSREAINKVVIGQKLSQLEVQDYINKNSSAVNKSANTKKKNKAVLAMPAETAKHNTDKKHEIISEADKTAALPDNNVESVEANATKTPLANTIPPIDAQNQTAINPEGEEVVKQNLTETVAVNKKDSVIGDIASKQEAEQAQPKAQIIKQKKNNSNSFFVGISTGVDVSFVNGNKAGTLKPVAGIGVGYTFRNRFTVRTGFYAGRKVYSADGDSYNGNASFYQYYRYLESVDANCKIYEIPLLFSYHLGKNARHSWMLTTGLSTLLMKEESYHYFYKYTANGALYNRKWTIKDENNHFFSVLTLSAGYNRSLGKRFKLLAEPYLKLPLNGIGAGSIKLNSGGVLFTLGYRIF